MNRLLMMSLRNLSAVLIFIFIFCANVCVAVPVPFFTTFASSFDLPIPAPPDTTKGWAKDAVINVTEHRTIIDIDISIDITHTNIFDLQIFLQSPQGTTVLLNMYDFNEQLITGTNYVQTIFDDHAQIAIEQASPPFTGRFKPKAGNFLNAFDGQDAYGPWKLKVYDAFFLDAGTLNNVELMFLSPEPSTLALIATAVLLLPVYRSKYKNYSGSIKPTC